MNINNSGNYPSDTYDGFLHGGNVSNPNNTTKDINHDDSSTGLMFSAKQVNTTTNNTTTQPKEGGIGRILTTLHLEWNKHEIEKNKWAVERAEYEAKITILEGRAKSYANINNELLQRIKMLESALLVARSQVKFGDESVISENTSIEQYQVPKSIYTREQSKRGRHLLQQYLKEIQIIDETIKMKNLTDSKIVEYLMKTSSDAMTTPTILNCLQSGYDSTNYIKTFGHPDPKKSTPMSLYESTKLLDDMKKGYKRCVNDRKRDTASKSHSIDNDDDDDDDDKVTLKINENFNKNTIKNDDVPFFTDSQSYDPASHLFDILKSFGGSSAQFIPNNDENPDTNTTHTSNVVNEKEFVDSSSVMSNNNLPGGVVRKKDHTTKKSSRIKLDMLNLNEDNFSGDGALPKKNEEPPSVVNIFAKPSESSDTQADQLNINNQFESKLDILARRFNLGSSDDSSDKSSSIDTINSISSTLPIKTSVVEKDIDNDVDLGILNEIDDLITSSDDPSNLLTNSSNDDVSLSHGSNSNTASIQQKHWNINSVLRGHNDSVTCVGLHPTDKIAVSSSLDGLVYLWYYNDKKKSDMYPTWFLRGHEFPVLHCLFNNIGDCLYTSDVHGNILVWNISNDVSLLCRYQAHDEAIWYMSYNYSINTLLSASADGVCSFWKPDSFEPISTFNIESSNQLGIISADFSPLDHSKIVLAVADSIYLYDVNSEKTVLDLKLDDSYLPTPSSSSGLIQCTSLHPSNNIYATGWGHNQVKIIDLTSGKFITSFIAHPAPITSIAFGTDTSGTYLATGGANGSIHMWSNSYSCYQDVPPHRVKHHSGVNSLSFHKAFPHMITGGADELVKLYI